MRTCSSAASTLSLQQSGERRRLLACITWAWALNKLSHFLLLTSTSIKVRFAIDQKSRACFPGSVAGHSAVFPEPEAPPAGAAGLGNGAVLEQCGISAAVNFRISSTLSVRPKASFSSLRVS